MKILRISKDDENCAILAIGGVHTAEIPRFLKSTKSCSSEVIEEGARLDAALAEARSLRAEAEAAKEGRHQADLQVFRIIMVKVG